MHLLVTRPEPDAERTAAALRARGHAVLAAALLQIEPIPAALGERHPTALLMSSASAARSLAGHPDLPLLRARPLFVVGAQTAAAARTAGFIEVTSADGNAGDLAHLVVRRFAGSDARLLYLCGEQRAGDLAGLLARAGLDVETIAIYRANAAQRFPPEAAAALRAGTIDGVLHFSRRTAQAFLACADAHGARPEALRPAHYCLSAQVAGPLVDAGAAVVRIAARADEAALIDLLEA